MTLRAYDSPIPSTLTAGVQDFLKKRGERALLGKPATEALAVAVRVPAHWTEEQRAAVEETMARFDRYSMEDKGTISVAVLQFLNARRERLEDTPGGRLLLDGISLWSELATEAGMAYDRNLSAKVNKARAQAAFRRWDELLEHAEQRAGARIVQLINDQLVLELERLEAAVEATLAGERELMTAAFDEAQKDATAARRDLAAAQATATRDKQALEARVAQLEQTLARERSATVNREREHRNEVHQLRQDLKNAQVVIGALNRECEQLSAQAGAAPAPEILPPAPAPEALPGALAQHSWVLFLRSCGIPAELRGLDVHHAAPLSDVDRLSKEWRREIPTVQAAREQIRAALLPVLRGAA